MRCGGAAIRGHKAERLARLQHSQFDFKSWTASVSGEQCAYGPDRRTSRQLSCTGGTGEFDHVYKVSLTRSFHHMLLSANEIETLQTFVLMIQTVVRIFEYIICPGMGKL